MNRFIKYSKNYRLSLICLIAAVVFSIVLVAVGASMYQSPEVVMALFFGPAIVAVIFMLSIFFWWKGESRRFGFSIPK